MTPPGWVPFGAHAAPDRCDYDGPLEFAEHGEDGMPRWERHADCQVLTAREASVSEVVHKRIEVVDGYTLPCDRGQRFASFTWTDHWDEVTCPDCLATTGGRT